MPIPTTNDTTNHTTNDDHTNTHPSLSGGERINSEQCVMIIGLTHKVAHGRLNSEGEGGRDEGVSNRTFILKL